MRSGIYPTSLSGTSVLFNGIAAPMIYTSATQAAAVVPYEVSGASVQVSVHIPERHRPGCERSR